MTDCIAENSQRAYGRIAGFALLLIIASGVLTNHLVVSGDAAATAQNVMAHERQFRIGIFGELIMLNGDVLLALALYALLKPVNANLALLGAFWRLANAFVLGVGVVASLVALDFLTDTTAARYLTAFKPDQLHALTMQFLDIHGAATLIGLIFFSLGAATHSYLLWRSGYIPRVLSVAYLVVSAVILVSCSAIVIFPSLDPLIDPWFILPDFVVELLVALWLVIKGATIQPLARRNVTP
jgi:hypothetical protein